MPTVGSIAEQLGFEADGAVSIEIDTVAHPSVAGPSELALAMDKKHAAFLADSAAKAAMVAPGFDWRAAGLEAAIYAPRSRYAMAGATAMFAYPLDLEPGVHPSAVVSPEAELGEDCWVGPLAVIGRGAKIGASARICGQASIGAEAQLGAGALIHAGARIAPRVRIGLRAIVHQNAVIGSDGFSFVTPEPSSVETAKATGRAVVEAENRVWARIHSLGAVELGDDVEIGAGAVIDRGTVIDTRIGDGTKIDNLVQIGHNVQIGQNCLICGHVGIAGSTEIGDQVVLGGKAGVADHVKIGSQSMIMAGGMVGTNVKPRTVVGGLPAVARDEFKRIFLATRRLPKLFDEVRALKKRLSNDDGSG